jgi:hypothetical protein
MTMKRYELLIPRVAFGIAAVAMTAITIGVSLVMPAKMGSDSPEPRMPAALKVTASASTGAESVDVVAVHEPGSFMVPCTSSNPNRKPEG